MQPTHGGQTWREEPGSGAAVAASRVYLVADGSDVTISPTWPEQFAFYDVEQNGDYWLLNLTPYYLVSDGAGGLTINQVGPAAAVLADDGAGGIDVTTDLGRAPIADLFADTGGDIWVVRRTCDRLDAVQIAGGGVQFY